MQAVQSTYLRASRITHPKHSPLVNPLTFGLRQEPRKAVAEGLTYTTTRYERPFWKLRDTEKIESGAQRKPSHQVGLHLLPMYLQGR